MKIETLHIVSLDVPVPPDYGGVIDIFFRAKALKSLGIKIILHCFEYGRGTQHDFSEIADEVYFYKRKRSLLANFRKDPFIVATRKSEDLVNRLLLDNFPVLLEGHHCSGLLNDERLSERTKFVRVHNIEWMYYDALSHASASPWKKTFFKGESKKLKKFDKVLRKADALFCLNALELEYYREINPNHFLWPVGCDYSVPESVKTESFALFQGNLSVAENEKALRWIVETWTNHKIPLPLVVAGKNPSRALQDFLSKHTFVKLQQNPSSAEMSRLIQTAEINLLITFQSTGIKLKLLNALLQGNRCIVNPLMVEGTDLGQFCEIVDDAYELGEALQKRYSFSDQAKKERRAYLSQHFDPVANARKALDRMEMIRE